MKSAIFLICAILPWISSAVDDKKWIWNNNNRRSDDDGDASVVNASPSVNQIKIKLDDQDDATSNKYTQDSPSSDDPYDTFSGGPVSGNFRPPPDYSRPYNPPANIYPQVGGNNYPNNGEPGRYPQNGERYPQNGGRFPQNGGKYPEENNNWNDHDRYPNQKYPEENDNWNANDRYPNRGNVGYGLGAYPENGGFPNRIPGYPGGNRYPSDGNRFPGHFPNNEIDRYPSGGRYPNEGERYPVGGQYPSGGRYPQQGGYPGGEGYYPDQDKFSPNNPFRPFRPNQSFRPGQGRPYPSPFEGPVGPGGRPGQGGGSNKCACVDRFQCPSPGMLGGQCAPGKSFCCYNRPGGFNRPGPAINPLTGRPIHNPANGVLAGPGGPVDHLPGHKTNPDNTGDGSSANPVHLGFGNGFQSIDDFHKTNGFHNTNGFKPINGFHNTNGFQPVNGFQSRNGFVPIIPVNCQCNKINNNYCNGGGGNTDQVNFGNCNNNRLTSQAFNNNNGIALNNNNNHNSGSDAFQASLGDHATQNIREQNGFQNNGVTVATVNSFQGNFGATNNREQNGFNNNGGQYGSYYNNGVGVTVSSAGFNNNHGVTVSTNDLNNNINNGRNEFNNNNNFNNGYRNNNEIGIGVTVSAIGIHNNNNGGQNGFNNNNNGGQNGFHNNNIGQNGFHNNNGGVDGFNDNNNEQNDLNNNKIQNGLNNNKPQNGFTNNDGGINGFMNNKEHSGFNNNNGGQIGLNNNYRQNGFTDNYGGQNEFNNNNNGQSEVNTNGVKPNMHPIVNEFGIAATVNTNTNNVGIVAGSSQGGFQGSFGVQSNTNGIKPNTRQISESGFGITGTINGGGVKVNVGGQSVGVMIAPLLANQVGFNNVQASTGVNNFQNNIAIGSNTAQNHVASGIFNSNFLNTNALGINSIQENFGSSTNFNQNNHMNINSFATNVFHNNNVHNPNGAHGNVGANVLTTQGNKGTGVLNVGFRGTAVNGVNVGVGGRIGAIVVPGNNVGFGVGNKGNAEIGTTGVSIVPGVSVGIRVNGNGEAIGNGVNVGVGGTRVNAISGVNVRYGVNGISGTIGNGINVGIGGTGANVRYGVPGNVETFENGVNGGVSGTRVVPGVNVRYGINGIKGTIANGVNVGLGGTGINVGYDVPGNVGTLENGVNVGVGGTGVNVVPGVNVVYGINGIGGSFANGVNVGLDGTGVNYAYGVNGNGGTIGNRVNVGVGGTRVNIVPGVNFGVNGNGGNRGNVPRSVSGNIGQVPINLPLVPIAQNGSGGLTLNVRVNSGSNISNSVLGSQPYFNGSNGKPITFRVIGARFGPPKQGGVRLFNGSRATHIRQNGPNALRIIDDREYARPLFQVNWLNGMANAVKVFYRIISYEEPIHYDGHHKATTGILTPVKPADILPDGYSQKHRNGDLPDRPTHVQRPSQEYFSFGDDKQNGYHGMRQNTAKNDLPRESGTSVSHSQESTLYLEEPEKLNEPFVPFILTRSFNTPNQPRIHAMEDALNKELTKNKTSVPNNHAFPESHHEQQISLYSLSRSSIPYQPKNHSRIGEGKEELSEDGNKSPHDDEMKIKNNGEPISKPSQGTDFQSFLNKGTSMPTQLYEEHYIPKEVMEPKMPIKYSEEPIILDDEKIIGFLPSDSLISTFKSEDANNDKHHDLVNKFPTRKEKPTIRPKIVMEETPKVDEDDDLRYLHGILPRHPFEIEINRPLYRSNIPIIFKLNAALESINVGKPVVENKPLVRSGKPLIYGSDIDGLSPSDLREKLPADHSESVIPKLSNNPEYRSNNVASHINTDVDELVIKSSKPDETERKIFIAPDEHDLSNHGESASHSEPGKTLKNSDQHGATSIETPVKLEIPKGDTKRPNEYGNGEDLSYLNRETQISPQGTSKPESIPAKPSTLVQNPRGTTYKNYGADLSRTPLEAKKSIQQSTHPIMPVEHRVLYKNNRDVLSHINGDLPRTQFLGARKPDLVPNSPITLVEAPQRTIYNINGADLSYLSGDLPKTQLGDKKTDASPTMPVKKSHSTINNNNGADLTYLSGGTPRTPLGAVRTNSYTSNPIIPLENHGTIFTEKRSDISHLSGASSRVPLGNRKPDSESTNYTSNPIIPLGNHGTIFTDRKTDLSYLNGASSRAQLGTRKPNSIPINPMLPAETLNGMIYNNNGADLEYLNGGTPRTPLGARKPDRVPTKAVAHEFTEDNSQNNGKTYKTAPNTRSFDDDEAVDLGHLNKDSHGILFGMKTLVSKPTVLLKPNSTKLPKTNGHSLKSNHEVITSINGTKERYFYPGSLAAKSTKSGSTNIGLIKPVNSEGSRVGAVKSPKTSGLGIIGHILKDFGAKLRLLPKEFDSPSKLIDC